MILIRTEINSIKFKFNDKFNNLTLLELAGTKPGVTIAETNGIEAVI